jgi:hypothetical protein
MTLPGASPGVSNGWKSGALLPLARLRKSAVVLNRCLRAHGEQAISFRNRSPGEGLLLAVSFDLLQSVSPQQADGE